MTISEESEDREGLEHFALAQENDQLIRIIDLVARSMGLETWHDLEGIVHKAKADCDRLRKLYECAKNYNNMFMIPGDKESFDEFREWIDKFCKP